MSETPCLFDVEFSVHFVLMMLSVFFYYELKSEKRISGGSFLFYSILSTQSPIYRGA